MNEINRYHYLLYFDHNGSRKARESVNKALKAIVKILDDEFGNNDNILEYGLNHDFTEDVKDDYKEIK